MAARKAMSGREGGVVEWADYAALKAQAADYEARIKELEQDVDEDAAAIQQLEQVYSYFNMNLFLYVLYCSSVLHQLFCLLYVICFVIITMIIITRNVYLKLQ